MRTESMSAVSARLEEQRLRNQPRAFIPCLQLRGGQGVHPLADPNPFGTISGWWGWPDPERLSSAVPLSCEPVTGVLHRWCDLLRIT